MKLVTKVYNILAAKIFSRKFLHRKLFTKMFDATYLSMQKARRLRTEKERERERKREKEKEKEK